jgi:hypothetical protein
LEKVLKLPAELPGKTIHASGTLSPHWNQKLPLQVLRREAEKQLQEGPGDEAREVEIRGRRTPQPDEAAIFRAARLIPDRNAAFAIGSAAHFSPNDNALPRAGRFCDRFFRFPRAAGLNLSH